MLDGLDENRLAEIRAATKADCITGLSEAVGDWTKRMIDRLPSKSPLEDILERYSRRMNNLAHLPVEDREDVLEAYARAGRFREGKTTVSQSNFVSKIKRTPDDLTKLHPVRHFMDPILDADGPVSDFSPEATLYIVSHFALGLRLPSYFPEITRRIKEYMQNPDNQTQLVDPTGVIRLSPFIRVHAMFAEAPQEVAEIEKHVEESSPEIEAGISEELDETPFSFGDEEGIEEDDQEEFQRTHRFQRNTKYS